MLSTRRTHRYCGLSKREHIGALSHEHILPLFACIHTPFADFFVTQLCPRILLVSLLRTTRGVVYLFIYLFHFPDYGNKHCLQSLSFVLRNHRRRGLTYPSFEGSAPSDVLGCYMKLDSYEDSSTFFI
ncbi:hypothetical protein C8R43DRAFT_239322 [Mycena crocata]|nr:hypothetical protein C8R43DRAFT_239322 [Mycena crocata]